MPKFLIERHIPGASKLSSDQLKDIAKTSNAVIADLETDYVWHTSYVVGDTVYCIHEAESPEAIHRHARQGGFPADKVTPVDAEISPATAGG